MKKLKASKEFIVGKNNIGYVSSSFNLYFKDKEFEDVKELPTFQKLSRAMNDAEIESKLKPGICSLGDILAFLKNPPRETKDGYWNLFYLPSCVVDVYWRSGSRHWHVGAWQRDVNEWSEGDRVFSPATDLDSSAPHPFESLSLEIKELKIKVGDKEMIFVLKE